MSTSRPESAAGKSKVVLFGAGGLVAFLGVVLVSLNLRPAVTAVSPLFTPIDEDLGLGTTGMSVLGMIPTLMFGLAGFAAIRLVARIGLEKVAVTAMLMVTLGSALRAVAPNATVLTIASAIALLGAGFGNIVCPPLVKKYFANKVSSMSMVYTTGLQLGTIIPALITVPMANALGWRLSLGSWALLGLVAMGPWIAELAAARKSATPTSSSDNAQAYGGSAKRDKPLQAWRSRLGIAMAVAFGTNSLLTYSFFTWLPRIVEEEIGLSQSAGGTALALFSAIGLVFAIAMPIVAGRLENPFSMFALATVVYLVSFAGLLWFPTAAPWLLVALLGAGPLTFPLLLTLINLRTRTSAGSAALSGFAQGVGYILASLGPLLFGWLWDLGGSLTLPLVFLVVALVVLCTSAWIACQPRMLEDELEPAEPARS
ncbi:MAG TPA: MFS transporter [Dietzia timorensis]|uniref:MFS transporter n=1 Tax=Dietzia timorensis TaxID=499555 RepID=A0A921F6F3_9ACTN|nr:MFS transporter [Dietzia timorensis]HJE92145.1 MFS transporter [Dietzia timorensis]